MDDKFKKDLVEVLDEQFDKKFIKLFNLGFEEVVLPSIEKLEEEINGKFKQVNSRFEQMDARFDRLDRKADKIAENQLDYSIELNNHGKRIKHLEQAGTSN